MAADTIDHATFSRLVRTGAVQEAKVIGERGGWTLVVKYGAHEHRLASKNRGTTRVWRRFETLAAYLKDIGLTEFGVDASGYRPDSAAASRRPDRAAALKMAHKAAAYDKWFREQVQASIDDLRTSLPGEHVEDDFATKRNALRSRLGGGGA